MLATDRTDPPGVAMDLVFRCVSDGERRRILGLLADEASGGVSVRDLVPVLGGATDRDGRARDRDDLELAVVHRHRPKLESAGLVAVRDDGRLHPTDHPAWGDTALREILATDLEAVRNGSVAETHRDAVFEGLASGRRRTTLDVLSHQFHPIHEETLAREVAARTLDTPEHRVPDDALESVLTTLLQTHLPKLDAAGLVDHDRDEGTVAYEGHPDLHVAWLHSVYAHEFRTSLTDESPSKEIGTIEGREGVISYGQSMGDRADDELFCMFTHKDMLEAGCFTRVLRAAARGVDVYLGTYDPTIKEFVREEAPDVTLWEPDTDWMSLPVESDRVGRLLMADREAVMLGTLKDPSEDEVPDEKAIVGDGRNNTLVVMIRQLLQSHLDRIVVDDSTDDVESPLHL